MSSTTVEHDLLLKSLEKYYSSNAKINTKIIDIIEGKSPISLRLIDWYVTTYCKSNNVVLTKNKREGYFNVYMNYRAQLKAFKKIQFDPFRRRERIMFWFATKDSSGISTTIGQLNFFKWAIENKILENIEKNRIFLEKEMNSPGKYPTAPIPPIRTTVQEGGRASGPSHGTASEPIRKKRCASSIKNMTKYAGSARISFE
jgi:hypothetical protein